MKYSPDSFRRRHPLQWVNLWVDRSLKCGWYRDKVFALHSAMVCGAKIKIIAKILLTNRWCLRRVCMSSAFPLANRRQLFLNRVFVNEIYRYSQRESVSNTRFKNTVKDNKRVGTNGLKVSVRSPPAK
jgi:hypothetical protein